MWRAATILFLSLTAQMATTIPAHACRGAQFHQVVLLPAIPPIAQNSPVIARVEILRIDRDKLAGSPPNFERATAIAKVLEGIRGVETNETIRIPADRTSCGGGVNGGNIGRSAYVAGKFTESGLFDGTWTLGQIGMDFFKAHPN
ncbi:hypothetical protein ACQKLX_07055 [Bosea sp. NPDC003192]|uniref:hypothetical protein n=1 Tax=Bosea sp. NPDC003192 TaxID=3390551 RepID=UPI003D08C28B